MRRIGLGLLLVLSAASCGGKSSSSDGDGGNGSAGNPTTGKPTAGNPSAGSSSSGGTGAKLGDCIFEGHFYLSGDSFPASDGCNSCSCYDSEISCTQLGCISECSSLDSSYQGLLERAKICDPEAPNQCTKLVVGGLTCGCETFVNPALFSSDAAAQVAEQFAANSCGGVVCGPCPPPAPNGYCGPGGQCVDAPELGDERACKVGGIIYPSGAGPIQDPFSCNQCGCDDGVLSCDDAACPKPCPADMKPGQGCAECGPIDNCLILEYACMPACVETCAQGTCVDGACVTYCG